MLLGRSIASQRERLRSLRLDQIGLLAAKLDVKLLPPLVCRHPLRAVGLQACQRGFTVRQLTFEQRRLITHRLEQTGVPGSLGAIATDGGLQHLPGRGRSAVAAAHDLLEAVLQRGLVAVDRVKPLWPTLAVARKKAASGIPVMSASFSAMRARVAPGAPQPAIDSSTCERAPSKRFTSEPALHRSRSRCALPVVRGAPGPGSADVLALGVGLG